jgi:hypothetical protein
VECFFIVIVFAVVLIFLATYHHVRKTALNETYDRLARRFGGRVQTGGWFEMPAATFIVDGVAVRVDIFDSGSKHSRYYTQVHLEWPDPQMRLEVFPDGIWSQMGRLIGMQDIEIGSPEFDRDYVIRSSDIEAVRAFLSGPVQYQVNLLRGLRGNGDIYVSLGAGELLVKKQGLIREFDQLQTLVQMSLELHAQAILTQSSGIEFEEQSAAQPIDSAMCQVCGESIESEMVICRRCKTPHHHDCWNYFGRCSTYGCGETRYYVPKTAPVLPARLRESSSPSESRGTGS